MVRLNPHLRQNYSIFMRNFKQNQHKLSNYHVQFSNPNLLCKGGRALRGKFGPLWSQKLKVAFHQFHPIGLLEEWFKRKILAFI